MVAKIASIPMTRLMNNVTCEITLTGVKTWRVRLWIGTLFFKLGTRIIGIKGNAKIGNATLGEMK